MEIRVTYDDKGKYHPNWHTLEVWVTVEDGRYGLMSVVGGDEGRMNVSGHLTRTEWQEATRLGKHSGHWLSHPQEKEA